MNLRLAKKTDLEEMIDIVKKTFSKQDSKLARKEFSEMFSNSANKPNYIVSVENKKIIGFAGFIQSWFDFNIYEIFWVAVDPDFQKKGVGKKIIKEIIKRIKSFRGHSKAHNIILSTSSPNFFMKCGFEKIAKLPHNSGFLMKMKL